MKAWVVPKGSRANREVQEPRFAVLDHENRSASEEKI